MGPFLADPVPSPRRYLWFGVGLAAAYAASSLAPRHAEWTPAADVTTHCIHVSIVNAPATPTLYKLGRIEILPHRARNHRMISDDMAAGYRTTMVETSQQKLGAHGLAMRYVPADAGLRNGNYLDAELRTLDTDVTHDPNVDGNPEIVVVRCSVNLERSEYARGHRIVRDTWALGDSSVTLPAQAGENPALERAAHEACIASALDDAFDRLLFPKYAND